MKITCPNCATKFAIGINKMGENGRKLKCSSCAHIWRQHDGEDNIELDDNPAPKQTTPAKAPTAKTKPAPKPEMSADTEENDQGAIDDMFATDDAASSEENDQGAIDDMFATDDAAGGEENDQGAIDDMFATDGASDSEENDQGAIDDMFATDGASDSEENDQNAIDDMFDNPLSGDINLKNQTVEVDTSDETTAKELGKSLKSKKIKKNKTTKSKISYLYWGSLGLVASLVFGVFIVAKDSIITNFPKSAAAYQLYGFETNIVGLEFVNINVRHQNQDGIEFLRINGSVINNSSRTKVLPEIRGFLVDNNGDSIFNWPIKISKRQLSAGEIVSFKSVMKDPTTKAQRVKFQFILDKKLADK